jgi:hypothetical protein
VEHSSRDRQRQHEHEEGPSDVRPGVAAGPVDGRRAADRQRVAAGFILFAVILMIMIGVFQALSGLVAILNNALYTVTDSTRCGSTGPPGAGSN